MKNGRTSPLGFSTRAIHHGYNPYAGEGSLNPPVYLNSTYAFNTVEDGSARFSGEQPGFVYSRIGNPTNQLLEVRLADLEGGEAALTTASGMGAITSLLWTLLAPGDEVIADKTLYGCTFGFLNHGLARFDTYKDFDPLVGNRISVASFATNQLERDRWRVAKVSSR